MSTRRPSKQSNKSKFAWFALILLLISVFVFWVLPLIRPNPERVKVEFVNEKK